MKTDDEYPVSGWRAGAVLAGSIALGVAFWTAVWWCLS